MFRLKKLTDCKWINLFEVLYKHKTTQERAWLMCSRKAHPITDAAKADAVMIIATVKTESGDKLVVTKEFRVPLWDYEYAFPAGLIDDSEDITETIVRELKEETGLEVVQIKHISMPVYSSAGMTDESNHMVLVEAAGTPSYHLQHPDEDIEVLLMDAEEIKKLLASDKKIAAKAWGIFYHFAQTGSIKAFLMGDDVR
jgi:ADP-ribose pyrophosphatase